VDQVLLLLGGTKGEIIRGKRFARVKPVIEVAPKSRMGGGQLISTL
jgi:hypothetical protein